jgi:seryl-tRNA synthetase
MIDIKLIRENPELVKQRYLAKEMDFSSEIDRILSLDGQRRELIFKTESLKAEQNKVTKQIPVMKKAGEDTAPIMAQMKVLSDNIKAIDTQLKAIEDEYNTLMLGLYNLPDS